MDEAAAEARGPVVWGSDEWELTGAADIAEVLRWAEENADDRHYTVYACIDRGQQFGLVHLLGVDPTVPT